MLYKLFQCEYSDNAVTLTLRSRLLCGTGVSLHRQQLFDLLLICLKSFSRFSVFIVFYFTLTVYFLFSRCEQWFFSFWGPERDDLFWGGNTDLSEWVSTSLPHWTFPWASAAQYWLPAAEGALLTAGTALYYQTCAHLYRNSRPTWRLDGVPDFLYQFSFLMPLF